MGNSTLRRMKTRWTALANGDIWWTWPGSNRRPLPCHGSALPSAPQAHFAEERRLEHQRLIYSLAAAQLSQTRHSSDSSDSTRAIMPRTILTLDHLWDWLPAKNSVHTKSSRNSARVGWAKSIARAIPG